MRFYYIILLFCLSQSIFAAVLTLDQNKLEESPKGYGFFDPHNHNGGVVPPLALVNHYKFIYGKELSLRELKKFWQGLVNFYFTDDSIKFNERLSSVTKNVLNCNAPMSTCSRLRGKDKCRQTLINNIYNVFSATPTTAFDTAYAMRTKLFDVPGYRDQDSTHLRDQAFLFELAKTKVDLVEMTKVYMWAQYKDPNADPETAKDPTKDFIKFAEITKDLRAKKTSRKNRKFKKRLQSLGLSVPRVKWLLMTHTLQLSMNSPDETLIYSDGQCKRVPMPAVNTDPSQSIFRTLVDFEDVVGVDVAGPENSCFDEFGMGQFKMLAKATYLASKEKRKNHKRHGKLVVRAHVGEGYPVPINRPKLHTNQEDSCKAAKIFPKVETRNTRKTEEPVHHVEARENIKYILNAIAELKLEHPDISDYVVFRLGHLTHIDEASAKKAKKLGVTADVNLSSNLATGAWTVRQEIIDEYLIKKAITPNKIRSLLHTLVAQGASLGEIFDGHGLKWLLYYDIPTTLGSDGSGVEHSDSMAYEYNMAKELIDFWNKKDGSFAEKNISIDDLLKNQKLHYEAMGYHLETE